MELIITTKEVRLGDYKGDHADFTADYGSAPPTPAHPGCTRSYIPGVRHSSHTPGAQLGGGPKQWPEGDAIIAALPTLLAKRAARWAAAQAAAQAAYEAQQQQQQQQTPPSQPAGGSQG